MGCLIQLIIVLICVGGGLVLWSAPGAIIGLLLAFILIGKLNSHYQYIVVSVLHLAEIVFHHALSAHCSHKAHLQR